MGFHLAALCRLPSPVNLLFVWAALLWCHPSVVKVHLETTPRVLRGLPVWVIILRWHAVALEDIVRALLAVVCVLLQGVLQLTVTVPAKG